MKKKCEFCLKKKKDVNKVSSLLNGDFNVCEDCECNHFDSCRGCGKTMLTSSEIHTTDWQASIPYEFDLLLGYDPDDWEQYEPLRYKVVSEMESNWYCDDCYPKFKQMIDDKAWDKLLEAL